MFVFESRNFFLTFLYINLELSCCWCFYVNKRWNVILHTKYKKRIQKWIDALKSGEYQQCTNFLKRLQKNNQFSYCCLGVACKIYENETKKQLTDNEWNLSCLPLVVHEWLGLRHFSGLPQDPIIGKNNLYATCANDDKGWDFKKIANAIEKVFLKDES